MNHTKNKVKRILTRNIIISSIIWASVIIACSLNKDNSNNEFLLILLSGFFVEFLRMTSSNKAIEKEYKEEEV